MLCSPKVYCCIASLAICLSKVVSDDTTEDGEDATDDVNLYYGEDDFEYTTVEPALIESEKDELVSDADHRSIDSALDSIQEKMEYGLLKKQCPFYKNGKNTDLDQMSDVWQVAYYQLKKDIVCFKIYIKKTTDEEKDAYSEKYGSFSGKVNWTACELEIEGGEKSETQRRHFLQMSSKGIMENIVILEHNNPEDPHFSLQLEYPDQWLVVKNLLLMRDCDDGDVVVFTKVPLKPSRWDISEALTLFGEYTMEGKMACR